MIPAQNRVHVLAVNGPHARLAGPALSIVNPRLIRYSTDGSVAYIASGKPSGSRGVLTLVSMAAKGGPRVLADIPVPSRLVVALATADQAPLLAVIGENKLTMFQIDDPERPNPFQSMNLPDEVAHAGVLAADLSPDGKRLALMLGGGNRVMVVDVSNPAKPVALSTVELLPDERVPLLRDLQFAVDDHTLWVVTGDASESLRSGQHPARLIAVRLGGEAGASPNDVSVWKVAVVPGADAPLHIAVAKGQLLASGTTIRVAPENASVFFTAVRHEMFALEGTSAATPAGIKLVRENHDAGQLLKSGIEGGGPMSGAEGILSSLDVSADAQVVLATEARVGAAGGFELVVSAFPIFGQNARAEVIPLGKLSPNLVRPPFAIGAVRIQP